jgi:putative membrane protein
MENIMKHDLFALLALASALGLASAASATPNSQGDDFLKAAIQGDNSEIMLGKMAVQNQTASPRVKHFAQMLIDDHSQHLQKAEALAKAQGVQPPNGPTVGADTESAKLHLLSGASFDKEFAQYMINDHQNDIGDFKKEASRHDGNISRFAEASLPTLRKHLDTALALEER